MKIVQKRSIHLENKTQIGKPISTARERVRTNDQKPPNSYNNLLYKKIIKITHENRTKAFKFNPKTKPR